MFVGDDEDVAVLDVLVALGSVVGVPRVAEEMDTDGVHLRASHAAVSAEYSDSSDSMRSTFIRNAS